METLREDLKYLETKKRTDLKLFKRLLAPGGRGGNNAVVGSSGRSGSSKDGISSRDGRGIGGGQSSKSSRSRSGESDKRRGSSGNADGNAMGNKEVSNNNDGKGVISSSGNKAVVGSIGTGGRSNYDISKTDGKRGESSRGSESRSGDSTRRGGSGGVNGQRPRRARMLHGNLTFEQAARLNKLYQSDFQMFGYKMEPFLNRIKMLQRRREKMIVMMKARSKKQ